MLDGHVEDGSNDSEKHDEESKEIGAKSGLYERGALFLKT
jgi:hypothetical protein